MTCPVKNCGKTFVVKSKVELSFDVLAVEDLKEEGKNKMEDFFLMFIFVMGLVLFPAIKNREKIRISRVNQI